MPAESLPDQLSFRRLRIWIASRRSILSFERIEDTVRRFGERSSAPVACSDHTASFSVARVTTDRKTTPESLKRKNTPSAIYPGSNDSEFHLDNFRMPYVIVRCHSPRYRRSTKPGIRPLAFERILGRNDLIGIDFLESASKGHAWLVTYFHQEPGRAWNRFRHRLYGLSPRSLMTNNHVNGNRPKSQ